MFTSLRAELGCRSVHVADFWRLIAKLEHQELNANRVEPSLRTLKGLMFVHMYSVYEYVVVQSFAAAIRGFNSHALTYEQLKRSILSLAFHTQYQSIASLSERKSWQQKINMLVMSESQSLLVLPEHAFPTDDSHFRHHQLDTICAVLDLPQGALLPSNRLKGWINEVVENRNAIAHGRETAEAVGSRYTGSELDVRRNQLDELCNHLIAVLDAHSSSPGNFTR